jgi:STE24 endopeptidase
VGSSRRVLEALGVALAAGLLALAAWRLSATAVPDDLVLPRIDVDAVFGRHAVAEAVHYQRFFYATWILAEIALLATLALYARRGAVLAAESAAGPIGTGMLLGMLGLGIAWLVQTPFRLGEHWWARRHDRTNTGYLSWLLDDWATLAAEFLAVCLALLIVMALARRLGERWWLPGAAVFVAIAALFTFVAPYLDFTTKPLDDPALRAAARQDERALGVGPIPLRVEEVSDHTKDANAYAFGLGPSRRVVFWDTILRPPFSHAEQKVVLAHELSHHARRHLVKGIAWFALFALPGAWLLMRATRRRGGMGRPEAVPLALLVVAVLQLVALPAQNAISRRMEAEADWKALEVTRNPAAFQGVMTDFTRTSLVDPAPPGWVRAVLGTHPSLADRVAMAKAWAGRAHDLP